MIFFDHIKGCSKDTKSYKDGLWTWIKFAQSGTTTNFFKSPYPEIIITKGSTSIDNGISNYLLDSSSFSGANEWPDTWTGAETIKTLGQIITQYGPEQQIHKTLTIASDKTFRVGRVLMLNSGNLEFSPTDTQDGLQAYSYDYNLTYFVLNASGITVKSNATFEKTITCKDQITAVSFNATSDKRAKTNIKRLDQEKALDIVNKLPVYSFNYKKDNIPSIGVLAQEAAVYDGAIPNFSLVNNEQATGENGDYQTVKESKLVYILWAAIQEQSRQINQLKSQLKELQK